MTLDLTKRQFSAASHPHTIVVAESPPKYSEVWMTRMTQILRPSVEGAYLRKTRLEPGSNEQATFLLPNFAGKLPRRATAAFSPLASAKLLKIMAQQPEARVLIHYLTTAVCVEKAILQAPNPVYIHCHGHDVTWSRKIESLPFLSAQPRHYVQRVRRLAEKATLIANSQDTVAKLRDIGIDDSRIELKYYGVAVPDAFPRASANQGKSVTVLYVGRLTDFKGPVEVVRAFDRACRMGMEGRLIMAGSGAQRAACEEARAQTLRPESIELLGAVAADRVSQLCTEADIFTAHNQASPSTGQVEAFGVSVVEAMAAGLPVVTGRSGGVCETVVDGETGFLFEPGNVEAHAEKLKQLADDPGLRESQGRAGYQRAKDCFSMEEEKRRLREILQIPS